MERRGPIVPQGSIGAPLAIPPSVSQVFVPPEEEEERQERRRRLRTTGMIAAGGRRANPP